MSDLFEERHAKLEALIEGGINPYPSAFEDRMPISEARDLAPPAPEEEGAPPPDPGPTVRVAGRIMRRRNFGKMIFVDLSDEHGALQVMVRKNDVGEEFHKLVRKQLDDGDFLGIEGPIGRSKTGEVTVFATGGQVLSKSLRPLPEKWHGLTDADLRVRYRYVDLLANPDVRKQFALRSHVVQETRRILNDQAFLEVETPLLHPIAGGALARPFVTHHNTLDLELYLRIAPELYLKRLLVGGFEKVFEIGRVFRNEGISPRHNPEFTMLELYWAYVDWQAVMNLTEDLITALAAKYCEGGKTSLGGRDIPLTGPFHRRPYHDLVEEHAGVDPRDPDALAARMKELKIKDPGLGPAKMLDELFEETVIPKLIEPTFVTHYPTELCPLSKNNVEDPSVCDRFELFVNTWELANAFSELNDPLDQRRRFEEQVASRDPESAAEVDEDYLRALEHGMPPAAGLGIGIDRLVMVLGGFESIRETILFPLRRPTQQQQAEAGEQEAGEEPARESAEGGGAG